MSENNTQPGAQPTLHYVTAPRRAPRSIATAVAVATIGSAFILALFSPLLPISTENFDILTMIIGVLLALGTCATIAALVGPHLDWRAKLIVIVGLAVIVGCVLLKLFVPVPK